MTDVLAVDVALLLPRKVAQQVVDWNRCLPDRRVEIDDCFVVPHISLWMGCVPGNALVEMQKMLMGVLSDESALNLTVSGVAYGEYNGDTTVASLAVDSTPQLMQLHVDICAAFAGLEGRQGHSECFADAGHVDQATVDYVNGYTNRQVRERYWPHITLGFGRLDQSVAPFSFVADTVALCHLGPYCTCRDQHYSMQLQSLQ